MFKAIIEFHRSETVEYFATRGDAMDFLARNVVTTRDTRGRLGGPGTAHGWRVEPVEHWTPSYCNHAHRSDGTPVEHECRILPRAAMLAEMRGDIPAAINILRTTPARVVMDNEETAPIRDMVARARLEPRGRATEILRQAWEAAGYMPWPDESVKETAAMLSEWCDDRAAEAWEVERAGWPHPSGLRADLRGPE